MDTAETTERIGQIKAMTANTILANAVMQYEKQLKEIETNVASQTQEEIVKKIKTENEKLEGETKTAQAQGKITEQTANEVIKQITTNTIEQGLRIQAQKAGLIKTGAEIKSIEKGIQKITSEISTMAQQMIYKGQEVNIQKLEVDIKEKLMQIQGEITDFNTSTPEQIKQWTEIITGFIPLIGKRK